MRALTVMQPWSWAIAHAGKNIENRARRFSYRGPLAIHAGLSWEPWGSRSPLITGALDPHRPRFARGRHVAPWSYPLFDVAAVVAVTELIDVHRGEGCCRPWGHATNLRLAQRDRPVYHLVLSGTRALERPVSCTGAQGLWTLPAAVAAAVAGQVGQTAAVSAPPSSPESVGPGPGV